MRHDDIDIETNELRRELGKTVVLTVRPAKLDGYVLALHVTEVAQSRPERFDAGGPSRCGGCTQEGDPGQLPGPLLRDRGKRRDKNARRRRRDECPSVHRPFASFARSAYD